MVAKIYAAEMPVLELGRNFEKQAQCSQGIIIKGIENVYYDYGTLIFHNHKLGNYIIVSLM